MSGVLALAPNKQFSNFEMKRFGRHAVALIIQ